MLDKVIVPKILFIYSKDTSLNTLKQNLGTNNIVFESINDTEKALQYIKNNRVEICFIAYELDNIDSIEFIKKLSKLDVKTLKVIISEEKQIDLIKRAKESGAIDVLFSGEENFNKHLKSYIDLVTVNNCFNLNLIEFELLQDNFLDVYQDSIVVFNFEKIHYCNDNFLKMIEAKSMEELNTVSIKSIIHNNFLGVSFERLKNLIKNKRNTKAMKYKLITLKNNYLTVEVVTFLQEVNHKRLIFAFLKDMTSYEKSLEKANRFEGFIENNLFSVLEQQSELINSLNLQGNNLNYNESIEELLELNNSIIYKLKQFLDLTLMEKEEFKLHKTEFDLAQLFKTIEEDFLDLIYEHKVAFLFLLDDRMINDNDNILFFGDELRIKSMLSVIMKILIEFSPIDSTIMVNISKSDYYLIDLFCKEEVDDFILASLDSFKNIEEVNLEDMHLYKSQIIAKLHNGLISYTNSDFGTHFFIELPLEL